MEHTTKEAKPAKAPKAVKEPKPAKEIVAKIVQNDVTRPKDGSKTGNVWSIADAISNEKKVPADRASVIAKAVAEGINQATASTQYGLWTKFHGVVAPRKEKVIKAPKAEITEPTEVPAVTE